MITRMLRTGTILAVYRAGAATAFPLIDQTNQDQVPAGTELEAPDSQALQHQLQLANGLAAPAGGGWTFLPRLDLQEMLTDNVLQQHTPRRWDLATFASPGIGVAADLPRLQLKFDFAPTLALYARSGSLNALTEQLSGIGLVTVVPELAFVDVRALAGVHSLYGGVGGAGTIGAAGGASSASVSSLSAGNDAGLNKSNEVQTDSFAISPYLLRRFGDYGLGKLGYSLAVTHSNQLTGFASSPFSTGGGNGQTLVTHEEIAHFATGEILDGLQSVFDINLQQSNSSTGAAFAASTTGLPATPNTTSTRELVSDQLNYVLSRAITVFASGGHESIDYGDTFQPIDDLTWSFGATLTPNPDSLLTVSYGHLNGYNSLSAQGYYAVTARTNLTFSYGSTLGTQLQNLQSQLNQATVSSSGSLVSGQNGGQLFNNANGLSVQNGVFRTDTLTVGAQTDLDRDIFAANLFVTKQSQVGGPGSSTTRSNTINFQWTHELQPDLLLSSSLSYSKQEQGAGTVLNPGNSWSASAGVALRYQISETLTGSLRYSYFDRQSDVTAYSICQNLLILGITKSF